MKVNAVFTKLKVITSVATLFLLSCKSEKAKIVETNTIKFITKLDPAFDESSEIIFIDSGSQKKLSLLIKKDFLRSTSSEGIDHTCYFKSIILNSYQTELVYDSILNSWNSHPPQKDIVISDGIYVTHYYIRNKDTSFISYKPFSKSDTITYRINKILNTYQNLFKDSIVISYLNVIREYLGEPIGSTDISPYRLLMIKNYPALRYSPSK